MHFLGEYSSDHPRILKQSETNGRVRLNLAIKPRFLILLSTRKSVRTLHFNILK